MASSRVCALHGCSNAGVRNDNKFVQCFGGCDRWFHWKCANLNVTLVTACRDISGLYWFCEDCKNSSNFYLHSKVDTILAFLESLQSATKEIEKNLESKIINCYELISNLASINSQVNQQMLAKPCCHIQNTHQVSHSVPINPSDPDEETTALDLSTNVIFSDELAEASLDVVPGKRKLIDDSSIKNHKRSRTTDIISSDLANGSSSSPDVAEIHSEVATTSSISNVKESAPEVIVLSPGSSGPSVLPGNIEYGICPAVAGQDATPPIDEVSTPTVTSQTTTTMVNYNSLDQPFIQSSVPVPVTYSVVTGNDENSIRPAVAGLDSALLIDFSSSGADSLNPRDMPPTVSMPADVVPHQTIVAAPHPEQTSVHQQPAHLVSTVSNFSRAAFPPIRAYVNSIGASGYYSSPSNAHTHRLKQPTMPPTHPVSAASIVFTGNAYNSICPAEAGLDTTPLINASLRSRYPAQQPATLAANVHSRAAPAQLMSQRSAPRPAYLQPVLRAPAAPQQAPYWHVSQASARSSSGTISGVPTASSSFHVNSIPSSGLSAGPTTVAAPVLLPPQARTMKHFYVKPFEPNTTEDDIINYVCHQTGWNLEDFSCHRLASESSSRRRTFVSFRIATVDNPCFTHVISSPSFWPDFVSIVPFKPKRK